MVPLILGDPQICWFVRVRGGGAEQGSAGVGALGPRFIVTLNINFSGIMEKRMETTT